MNLLQLPAEILKEIVRQVDLLDCRIRDENAASPPRQPAKNLTSLALTCPAFHALAVPIIYSQFEIEWRFHTSGNHKVEKVLYNGLRTLAMGDLFQSDLTNPCRQFPQSTLQALSAASRGATRWGNNYAQYIRKFSLQATLLRDHAMDSANMIGTLIALAVSKMVKLETFIWDIPLLIPREVWVALSLLTDRPGYECRLERVWIQFPNYLGFDSGKYPTASILPPLKSLTVLDIDQPSYLEEMAMLIERSRDRLRELNISIAVGCKNEKWTRPSKSLSQALEKSSEWPRPDGVLEILESSFQTPKSTETMENVTDSDKNQVPHRISGPALVTETPVPSGYQQEPTGSESSNHLSSPQEAKATGVLQLPEEQSNILQGSKDAPRVSNKFFQTFPDNGHASLKLEVLELERIDMSVPIMMRTIDWTKLTTLTILHCGKHEKLWRALRHQYPAQVAGQKRSGTGTEDAPTCFPLKIKHLHTDNVSPLLISFIKDSLAPNTLESVLLREELPGYESPISIDDIHQTVLCRHRSSLKRVLVRVYDDLERDPRRWRKWRFNRGVLSSIMSGKMPQLRELSMAIDRRDWQFFVQRLPEIPNLRTLQINDMDYGCTHNIPYLAEQLLAIVSVMPHLSLTHIDLDSYYYDIMETNPANDPDLATESDAELDFTHEDTDSENSDDEDEAGANNHGHENDEEDTDDGMDKVSSEDGDSDLSKQSASDDNGATAFEDGKAQRCFQLREVQRIESILIFDPHIGRL